jgi:hypothetical protein
MSTIAVWVSKAWLILTMAVTGFTSALPANVLQAPAPSATSTAAAPSYPRLQRAWAREQRVYDRLGRFFENVDQRIERGQQLIDKAKANGKDVSALQAALDAFQAAVKQARPTYEGLNGIVSSHQGFDANGAVVDPVKAFQTVLDMRDKLKEIRSTVFPAAKALRQAVHDFRLANQPAATPTP